MPQHIFEPERESSWRAYQESVFSDSEFDGLDTLLKIQISGRMYSKAQVGLRTQELDKAYDTLPLRNAVPEYDLPRITQGDLPTAGLEGDFHLEAANNIVYRFTGSGWLPLVGKFIISSTTPSITDPSITSETRYINTNSFIIYAFNGGWAPVGNLLLMPLLLWNTHEEIVAVTGNVSRSAIPAGTLVRLGDYVFSFNTSLTGTVGVYDILGSPTTVRVAMNGVGSWVYSTQTTATTFQENNWFQIGNRSLKLPLSHFDEARLVGFWFANPDGSFALSTSYDQASPTYRSVAVNDVQANVDRLRIAGQIGAMWGFSDPVDVPALTLYVNVVSGEVYLATVLQGNLATNQLIIQAMAPPVGQGVDGDMYFDPSSSLFYTRTAGSWQVGQPIIQRPGGATSDSRWGAAHQKGQFQISFIPQWDDTLNDYANTIVVPQGDVFLATIHRNYVSYWTNAGMIQKGDLSDQWPTSSFMDLPYGISAADVRIQSAYDFQPLGATGFATFYGFDSNIGWSKTTTYNQPNRLDGPINFYDYYQAVTSTYQDVLLRNTGITERHLQTLADLGFANQLIQLADNNWYASVNLGSIVWPLTAAAQDWTLQQHLPTSPFPVSIQSGALISRFFDDSEPISLQIQASCNYKTTFALPSNFFPGMTYLEWELAPNNGWVLPGFVDPGWVATA